MRILWVINTVLPVISESMGKVSGTDGGWLTGISNELTKDDDIKLIVCFPYTDGSVNGTVKNIKYYSFPRSGLYRYNKQVEDRLYNIIINENPDVVHIFGTEFPHSLSAVNAAERCRILNKTVISIQGLVSVYAKHYFAGLPSGAIHKFSLRDLLKFDNIRGQKNKYIVRGKYEIEAIKKAKHIIGRTDWDKACVKAINPNAQYHFCNETLRKEFYEGKWEPEKCEKHSIFISNSYYPIKGLHCVLEVMPQILKDFPDAKIYVPGQNPIESSGLKSFLHKTYYGIYLKKLIKRECLGSKIVFLGNLSAEKMRERMLKSNVFILPSSIENSPNTLGEAMLLGVPCIAADVGGVRNMAIDKKEALIYPFDENYILPLYIDTVFNEKDFTAKMAESGREHALKTHNREDNNRVLLNIYYNIAQKGKV